MPSYLFLCCVKSFFLLMMNVQDIKTNHSSDARSMVMTLPYQKRKKEYFNAAVCSAHLKDRVRLEVNALNKTGVLDHSLCIYIVYNYITNKDGTIQWSDYVNVYGAYGLNQFLF